MLRLIARRLSATVLVIVALTMIVFALSHATGDPRYAYMTPYSRPTSEEWEAQGRKMGLDKPLVVQYGIWLGNAARGDFGDSTHFHRNSLEIILERLPATLQLSGIAFVFSIALGVPLGVLSAVKRASIWDYLGRSFALLGQSVPPLLDRHSLHLHLCGIPGLAPHLSQRRLDALCHAGSHARLVAGRRPASTHAFLDARGP